MTTRLAGKDTYFLPFNMGTEEGGAGNPKPKNENQYATSYLWDRLFQRDAWLKVLGRFMHLQQEKIIFLNRFQTLFFMNPLIAV
jgi:type I restriction enzyme R subunit